MNSTETDTAAIYYVDSETGVAFQWHGGAYIEVGHFTEDRDAYETSLDTFKSSDVINVWDDAEDVSTLEQQAEADKVKGARRHFRRVLELFEQRCREYLAEQQDES